MNPSFFGLEGHPFVSTAGAEPGYFTESHAALVTELKAGLKAPHGITLVIGDEGTGKTSLIRSFAEEMANSSTVAYLPSTGPGLRHLLTEIVEQLGGTTPPAGDEQALLDTLRQLSRARAEHQRSTIVVVDDAHELPAKTIERLGRLFGDDPADPSMLHVILVGRPELLDRMNAANDRSILKHLVQVCRMDPIGPEESFRYIADRVAKVGGMVDRLFTEDALRLIVQRANGSPARIDAICSAALEQASELGDSPIGADTVDMACMQAVGNAVVENGTQAGRNGGATSYVFADDDVDAGGSGDDREGSGQSEMPNDENDSGPIGATAGGASLGGRLKAAYETRRSLILSAVGLIAILGAFSALMTGSGDKADRGPQLASKLSTVGGAKTTAVENRDRDKDARAELAASQSGKLGAASGSAANPRLGATDAATGAKSPLPSKPVSTPKLVVKRTSPSEPAPAALVVAKAETAAAKPMPAAAASSVKPSEASTQGESRAHIAPVHAAPVVREAAVSVATTPVEVGPEPAAVVPLKVASTATGNAANVAAAAGATEPVGVLAPPADVAQADPGARRAGRKKGEARKDRKKRAADATPEAAPATPTAPSAPSVAAKIVEPPAAPPAASAVSVKAPAAAPKTAPAPVLAKPTPTASSESAQAKPTAPPQTVATAKTPPAATTGGRKFTVQLGAFSKRSNAESLLAKVQPQYADGRIVEAVVNGGTVYRVMSGAFASKADADSRAKALAGNGYSTYVRSLTQ